MLLQSLVKYYDILAQDEESGIPKPGYGMAAVSYALVLSRDGEPLEVIPLKVKNEKGNKQIAQKRLVPEQVKKTSGISSNFLCENSSYVLGVDKKGKPERSKECFNHLKELHNQILGEVDCAEARAVVSFVNSWDPDKAAEHDALKDCLDEITDGGYIVFRLDGGSFVHQHPLIKKAWERYKAAPSDAPVMRCLVSGEEASIATIHPSIKGVRNAQSMGAAIVSFNARAYESYGRLGEQGANAPVSQQATFSYTTVLNHLLADSAHRLFLGDTTIVFWAESADPGYQDYASMLFDPSELEDKKQTTNGLVRDERAVREIKGIFSKLANGAPVGDYSGVFDEGTAFYVLGIAPNASRLAIRFFVRDSFGGFVENTTRHYEHLRIQKRYPSDPDILSLWRLLNETVSPKSSDKSASPLLAGAVLRSILTGLAYPAQ
ncbi:MAG: type I-C CRISPR-associated protein Cas8c/Csd1, partial [Acetanaerobacterium sp.]